MYINSLLKYGSRKKILSSFFLYIYFFFQNNDDGTQLFLNEHDM